MAVEYRVLNVPLTGINLMSSRVPRVQSSVPREYGADLSREVTLDLWTVDPTNGEPLNFEGKTIPQHMEEWILKRPHTLEPVTLEDATGECWTEGNISKQGLRLKELIAFTGSEKAAMVLLVEEAAKYGTKPGSTAKGVKISEGKSDKPAGSSTNPWDRKNFHGDEESRQAKIQSIIRNSTDMARTFAKSAGVKLDGTKLG